MTKAQEHLEAVFARPDTTFLRNWLVLPWNVTIKLQSFRHSDEYYLEIMSI